MSRNSISALFHPQTHAIIAFRTMKVGPWAQSRCDIMLKKRSDDVCVTKTQYVLYVACGTRYSRASAVGTMAADVEGVQRLLEELHRHSKENFPDSEVRA